VTLDGPRDREGTFSPVIVPKHSRRLDGFDEAIVSLYAKGLTTGEIQSHLDEIYGAEVSKDTISRITDAVNAEAIEWQNRPLDALYPVIFIDAIVVKIRDGSVANRPIYVAMAVTTDGDRDVLGLWVGNGGEGAKHWLSVLTEMKTRGVNDVLIVCCDGLNGLPEAVTGKDHDRPSDGYTAATLDAATERFAEFEEKWDERYPAVIRLWRDAWEEFIPFSAFPSQIRSMIYTTNAIEWLNSRFRRSTRIRGHFPNEQSALKVLSLTIKTRDVKGGNAIGRVRNWKTVLNTLLPHYGERINIHN
jgi:putative transposase